MDNKHIKELKKALEPIQEVLNLKLVMADLREFRLQECSDILHSLDQLSDLFVQYQLHDFDQAVRFLNDLMGEVVTEHISHYTGLSYVLNLYELMEDSLEDILAGQEVTKDFDKAFQRLKSMFEGVEVQHHQDEPDEILQDLPSQDIIDDGLLNDFINEVTEGLDSMESTILELEQNPEAKDLIDPVFRVMHTIKGTAGFLGIPVIARIAHRTEDLLGEVRDGKREAAPVFFDLLFKAMDCIKQLIFQLKDLLADEQPQLVKVGDFYQILAQCRGQVQNPTLPKVSPIPMPETQLPTSPEDLDWNEAMQQEAAESSSYSAEPEPSLPNASNGEAAKRAGSAAGTDGKGKFTEMLKVPAEKLDELSGLVGEMVVALSLLTQNPAIAELADRSIHSQLDHLEKISEALRDKVLGVRMFPIGNIFGKLNRQVRDLSHKSGKEINLEIKGADTMVDKSVIDSIYAPLMHLVRNSIDHGIEPAEQRRDLSKTPYGNIMLTAQHLGDSISIVISDDGRGLDEQKLMKKALEKGLAKEGEKYTEQEIFSFIFKPGFSTADTITDISGRGVGMDVVRRTVESLRGKISILSQKGYGTSMELKLPLTTSIIEGLVVSVGETRFILPILDVNLTVTPEKSELKGAQGKENEFFLLAGNLIPIVRLYQIYGLEPKVTDPSQAVIVVVNDGHRRYGLMVDELIHRQQIVIQKLGERFANLKGISGGTILGNGRVGLILDPVSLIHNRNEPASAEKNKTA